MEQETPRPDRQQHALARARSRADGRHAALQRSVSVASSMSDSSTAEEADEARELLEAGPDKALLLLGRQHIIRRASAALVTHRFFSWFILSMILANCVTLAMYSHQPGFAASAAGQAVSIADYVFTGVFTLELALKVLACGLVAAPGTYLRDPWNQLDAAVVVLGIVDVAVDGDAYVFLRTVRVLRPLRAITHVKWLKVPVATLVKALPMLMDVAVLCAFAFFIFGVVAVQLFAGALRNGCAVPDFSGAHVLASADSSSPGVYANVSYTPPPGSSTWQQCSGVLASDVVWAAAPAASNASSSSTPTWSGGSAGTGLSCASASAAAAAAAAGGDGSASGAGPLALFCAPLGNPNGGMTSFDNILWSWATIFQVITTEGWTDVLYALQDAVSPWVLVYFLLLVIFGSFFLVNLALAVLYLQFSQEFSRAPSLAASRAVSRATSAAASRSGSSRFAPASRCDSLAAAGAASGSVSGGGHKESPRQQQPSPRRAQRLLQLQLQQEEGQQPHRAEGAAAGADGTAEGSSAQQPGSQEGGMLQVAVPAGGELQACAQVPAAAAPRRSAGGLGGSQDGSLTPRRWLASSRPCPCGPDQAAPGEVVATVTIAPISSKAAGAGGVHSKADPDGPPHEQQRQQQQHRQPGAPAAGKQACSSTKQRRRSRWFCQPLCACIAHTLQPVGFAWSLLRQKCRDLLKSGWLELASLAVIVTNTAVMASHSYPGDPAWQAASDCLNVAFSLYFVAELCVKVLGAGARAFLGDRMNQFDALIVAASLVEVVVFLLPGDDSNTSSLSVLRSARLLRVFKLARCWPELNRIIGTILHSFSQVVHLSLLLLLFVFVFALMGLQLFGYKFATCDVPGAHQLCPPGMPAANCPMYPDCYVACDASRVFSWFVVPGSPYNGLAYCEQFPCAAGSSASDNYSTTAAAADAVARAGSQQYQYWAQVGKAVVPDSRFDNIGWSLVTVFQIITTENCVAYAAMAATSPAAYLYFVAIIVLGNYILLNLFLAILLENFSASSSRGSASLRSSTGNSGTLAAAARAAEVAAWLQRLLEGSWMAQLARRRRNRVHALTPDGQVGDAAAAAAAAAAAEHRTSTAASGGPDNRNHVQQPGAALAAVPLGPPPAAAGDAPAASGRRALGGAKVAFAGMADAPQDAAACTAGLKQQLQLLPSSPRGCAALPAHTRPLQGDDAAGSTAATSRAGSFCKQQPSFAQRRSFAPLIVPIKSSESLGDLRRASFLARPTREPSGSIERSFKSCSAAAGGAGISGQQGLGARSGSEPDLAARLTAGSCSGGGRALPGSISGHRLSMQHGAGAAVCVDAADGGSGSSSCTQPAQHEEAGWRQPQQQRQQQVADADAVEPLPQPSGTTQAVPQLQGRSLWLLGPDNALRRLLQALLLHPWFEHAVLLLIALSSVALALDMPGLDPDGPLKRALEVWDCVCAPLFLAEALIKVLVHGFLLNGPCSYLHNPWNVLDGFIVVVGMVVMGTSLAGMQHHTSLSSLRALRTLRALRPLRVASRLEGMKVVINSLFASLPALGNVLLVCLLMYVIFGIMAVDLLGGAMRSCQDSSGRLLDAAYVLPAGQPITRAWCEDGSVQVSSSAYHSRLNVSLPAYTPDKQWVNPVANYDNIALATFTLWQISTTELWVNTMYSAIAAVGVEQQPRPAHNPALALFFITFIVFGGFFVLQLFVSVTIDKFSELHQKQGRSALLTPAQEAWLQIERMMAEVDLQVKYAVPSQRWRAAAFHCTTSTAWELAVMAAILANCAAMALTHADMDDGWQAFMTWANLSFTAFFLLEVVLTLIALGVRPVLRDPWRLFDMFVVAVSIVGVGIDLGMASVDLQVLPLLRVLRVVRMFKLIPKAEGLRLLLRTLVLSLPALGNIVSVLLLFVFIYAVIGMNLWGAVKQGAYLNRHANFQHVGMALLTLFRMITGESWDGIMQDCMVTSMCVQVTDDVRLPGASSTSAASLAAGTWLDAGDARLAQLPAGAFVNRCSPSPIAAVLYFCSFVLLCGLVLVNFVIAVIIDNFERSSSQGSDLPISKALLDSFVQVWSELDPRASHFMPAIQLSTLIQALAPPLGVRGEAAGRAKVLGIIMSVDVPVRDGKIHFLETLHALAGRVAGAECPDDEESRIRAKMYPRLPSKDPSDEPKYGVSSYYAALYVQAAVRGFLRRHALKEGGGGSGSVCGRTSSAVGAAQHLQRRRSTHANWPWLPPGMRASTDALGHHGVGPAGHAHDGQQAHTQPAQPQQQLP